MQKAGADEFRQMHISVHQSALSYFLSYCRSCSQINVIPVRPSLPPFTMAISLMEQIDQCSYYYQFEKSFQIISTSYTGACQKPGKGRVSRLVCLLFFVSNRSTQVPLTWCNVRQLNIQSQSEKHRQWLSPRLKLVEDDGFEIEETQESPRSQSFSTERPTSAKDTPSSFAFREAVQSQFSLKLLKHLFLNYQTPSQSTRR